MLLHIWVVIKVVFGCAMKHRRDASGSRWNLSLLHNGRDISRPLDVVGLRKCIAMPI